VRCFSLFSGIGGFDLALQNLGHEIVGACEIDGYARQVYERHFPGVTVHHDATKVQADSLPHFDLLCGGFPCQAFSIAGKRRGFDDTRGSLFFEIARIAKEKKPSHLLLENVRGLLSHDKGETFRTIISTLDEVGYDAEWQVLNSKYFVPQNRERVFIVGHLRGASTRQVFPLGEINAEPAEKILRQVGNIDTKGLYAVVNDRGEFREVDVSSSLDANYWKGCDNHAQRTMIYMSNTNANMRQRVQDRSESWTLTNNSGDFGIMDGVRVRRLTPLECERLQGFPDGWTEGLSDTQRYRCIGNAVTVPVVEYIVERL